MKYNFTVWNFIIALLIPYVVYVLIRRDADPSTIMGAAYLIPVLFAGAVIDLILQMAIKNRKILAITEVITLVIIVVINMLP